MINFFGLRISKWSLLLFSGDMLAFALAVPLCFGAARIIRATPVLRDMVRS